jgi:integrase
MASVSRDANGTKRVCFTDGDGERRSVRLGRASVKAAESVSLRVEALLQDKELRRPHDAELASWLTELSERMHKRLARVGLVEPRTRAAVVTLGALLDRFDAAASVKPSTRAAYKQTTDSLRALLGAATPLSEITQAHADDWRKSIAEPVTVKGDDGKETTKQLAPATVAKRVHVARAVFKRAVRWGLIPSSPFADLRAGSQSNPDRAFYVAPEAIRAILLACPDDQWRAILALSRYAGLRCPSEIVALRWGDVNWERGRLTVRSPKTAGHECHAVRVVPIAPELRPILQDLFDRAEPGTEVVVPRLRDPAMNLRTTFGKIIAKAGVKPWPRLFHNMRASCATDWVERFPAHVVAGWLGHSPLIAARHYLQTRDAHFDLATGGGTVVAAAGTVEPEGGAQSGAPEAQNAAKHPAAPDRAGSPKPSDEPCFSGVSQAGANERDAAANEGNGRYWTPHSPWKLREKPSQAPLVARQVAHSVVIPAWTPVNLT